jgi:hypothetical protein
MFPELLCHLKLSSASDSSVLLNFQNGGKSAASKKSLRNAVLVCDNIIKAKNVLKPQPLVTNVLVSKSRPHFQIS